MDLGLASNNPALLRPTYHNEIALSFNSFFAGEAYQLTGAHYFDKKEVTAAASIFYIDHGDIPQTDASGNTAGSFRPRELVVQVSAAKAYLQKWKYGANLKLAHAAYGQYNSTALLFDAGLLFTDTAKHFSAGLLARNMGMQLGSFGSEREDLPFDLQLGMTKKLAKAPLGFSVTAGQIHRFRLGYNDTVFNAANGLPAKKQSFGTYLFNHFVFSTHIYISSQLELIAGYNRLRRSELSVGATGNGLGGFSAGLNLRFKKLHFQYGRSWYQSGYGYNQVGIGLDLKQLTGLGS